ncbi:hypothetical protein, partial [cf. Phormidesmis sp. LEGE 11477]|uniref:hypothetical protein n=1 Tax=cf. Phormidesmis sp. LEGE 11477 TaxID=1828680 RepID=UPI001D15D6B7
ITLADKQNTAASATYCQPTPPVGHPSGGRDLLQAYAFCCRGNNCCPFEIGDRSNIQYRSIQLFYEAMKNGDLPTNQRW